MAEQWHPTKNGDLTPYDITANSGKKVWWQCPKGLDHEWIAKPISRNNMSGCPICSGNKVVPSNCLATTHPELAKEWHPSKNGKLTPYDFVAGSNKKVWWKCPKGEDHEWYSKILSRSYHRGCPICTGNKVVKSNSLAFLRPDIMDIWHQTKNMKLSAYKFTVGSSKKVWWKCPKGDDHEWYAPIRDVTSDKSNCSVCRGLKVVRSNCLKTINPRIANEWHPTKNGKLTPNDITAYSGKRVWWKCPKGDDHEWRTTPGHRRLQVQILSVHIRLLSLAVPTLDKYFLTITMFLLAIVA